MSLWLDSLWNALSGYDGGYDGPTEIVRPFIIFTHLAMQAPRSWWEPYLLRGKPRKDHVTILRDLSNDLKKCPGLQGRINYSLLVAMAFLDDEAKSSFGNLPNQQSIEEYIAGAEKVLAERPDVRRLGKVVTKMAIQKETEIEGKYCPKCKKRRSKALMVTEMIAKWSDEGFYLPDDSNTDDMKTYEKCLACGTVLIEKPEKYTEEGKKDQKEFKYTIPDEYWEKIHNLDYLVENFKVDPVDTERHINFKVQDATLISSRKEVERQHKAWHERQKAKERVVGGLEEALAIIDDNSTNPEGAELTDQQKAELKEVVKKAFEDA